VAVDVRTRTHQPAPSPLVPWISSAASSAEGGIPVVVLVQPLAVVVVGASRIYPSAHWMIGVLGGMPWGNIGRRRRSGLSVVAKNRWGEHDRRSE
jgi:hypothetical protein